MARRPLLGVFLGAMLGAWMADVHVNRAPAGPGLTANLGDGGNGGLMPRGPMRLGATRSDERAGPVLIWSLVACAALIGLGVAVRTRRGVLVGSWVAAAALMGLTRAATGPPRAQVTTCGVVAGAAGFAESRWRARVDGPREGARVAAVLERELCGGTWQARQLRAHLSLWEGPAVVRGDVLELVLAVEAIGPARNRTDVDPRQRAMLDGIDVVARVRSPHLVVSRGRGTLALVDRARAAAGEALSRRLPRERAAVAKGLVMGDRSELTPTERDAWADAGLAHLLAVSGMHVTMVVVVVAGLVRFVLGFIPGVAERASLAMLGALVALPCATWFCLWSASPASALRATVMGGVGLAGVVLGRRGMALDALCFTGFVMLAFSPMLLHDPGFTLSMAAVASLLVVPSITAKADVIGWCKRQLYMSITASLVATAATLPITAATFGRVSLVAPLTNLVAVPLGATLATPLAIAVVMLAPVWSSAADIAAHALDYLLAALLVTVKVGASLPGAAIATPQPSFTQLVAYGGLLVALRRRAFVIAGVAGLVTVFAGASRHPAELTVEIPYVGQGDGIIVRTPSGDTMVIDAGGAITPAGADPGRTVMAPLLRTDGVRAVDLAVVTHPHPDHLGGFAYLAQRFTIRGLWSNGQDDAHPILQALRDNVRRSGGIAARPLELPTVVHFGGLAVDIIHPRAAPDSYLPELGLNNNSIVLRLTYGERRILLTGDIEALAEREIVAAGTPLDADILKVGHHGSRTSSSAIFLDAVRPQLAIASCGDHNDFGFPHRETRERFASRSIPLLTTRDDGAVRLHTDGTRWLISTQFFRAYLKASNVIGIEASDD
jgi:competence protein ComEC